MHVPLTAANQMSAVSIIIPAHNEANVIGQCLAELSEGLQRDEVEVIVVCNGCSDNTAEVARACGNHIRIIETPIASKANALNLGDEAAGCFPRFYVDADVRLRGDAVQRIAEVLRNGPYLAAAPSMSMDLGQASWPVRAFYRVWNRMSYTREGFMGAGVYALGEAGRRRFERFSDILGDDAYIRMLFTSSERIALPECRSVVKAPRSVRDLIRIKARSCLGRYQLRDRFPQLSAREAATKHYGANVSGIATRPLLWPHALVYLWVTVISKYRGRRLYRRIGRYVWERDESSRSATRPPRG